MRFLLASLAALVLAGCGSPAPLQVYTSTPQELAVFGPSVQYHAGRQGDTFTIDGVVDGVPSLEIALVRGGREVSRQPVPIQGQRFAFQLPGTADGDQIKLEGPGWRTTFQLSWPGRVDGGQAQVTKPAAPAAASAYGRSTLKASRASRP